MLLLLLACADEPWVTEATTDGGTWVVSTADAQVGVGEVDLLLTVTADGVGAEGLKLSLIPSMPDMGHSGDPATVVEQGGGDYLATLELEMAGLWALSGEVEGPNATEGFTLVVEAR